MAGVTPEKGDNETIAPLLELFPNVSVDVLRHYLDATDGNLEDASNLILENHLLEDAPPRQKLLPDGSSTQTNTKESRRTFHARQSEGDSTKRNTSLPAGSSTKASKEGSSRTSETNSAPGASIGNSKEAHHKNFVTTFGNLLGALVEHNPEKFFKSASEYTTEFDRINKEGSEATSSDLLTNTVSSLLKATTKKGDLHLRLCNAVCKNNAPEVARVLHDGADPNSCMQTEYKEYPVLTFAASRGFEEVVSRLLEARADPEKKGGHKVNSLHWAIAEGHISIVRNLLHHGARVNAIDDNSGYQPIHYATIFGFVEIAKVLKEHGCDLEAKDNFGNTPLHRATFYGKGATSKWLVEAGVSITAVNVEGKTALDMAVSLGHKYIAALLRIHTPNPHNSEGFGITASTLTIQESEVGDINFGGVQIILHGDGTINYKAS